MIRKLLFQNQDKKQLFIAMLGSFLGIVFLLTSIHYLIKIDEFGEGADVLGPNTIIVQKKVSNTNSLNLAKTDFDPQELASIKREHFVLDVKPVVSNNFDVSFETADKLVPRFRSDVFIQSVDKDFLDVQSTKWSWKEGDTVVPIILPRDFLVMLNTFMSAQEIPQISDDLAMQLNFKFTLSSSAGKEWVNAKIIGFTNEVASILVPESFMAYGNKVHGKPGGEKITQIMISAQESEFGRLEELLQKRHLESKKSQVDIGRLKSIVSTLILVVLGISVVAVFVSGLVLIQYAQLLMSRNAYEVRTLLRLGYPVHQLINAFFWYFVRVFGLIGGVSTAVFVGVKIYLDTLLADGGLYLDKQFTLLSFGALLLGYLLFAVASYRNARKGIFYAFYEV